MRGKISEIIYTHIMRFHVNAYKTILLTVKNLPLFPSNLSMNGLGSQLFILKIEKQQPY